MSAPKGKLSIGYHVGKLKPGGSMAESITASIAHAKAMGIEIGCVQIFVMSPQSSHISISPGDVAKIRELTDGGLRIYVHSSYITANIYKPESAGYGSVLCRQQLALCNDIGASGFVIHLPRESPAVAARGYRIACKYRGNVPIYMEIEVAKPPKQTYETPSKIQELIKELAAVDKNYGICIDTAHLWSCGEGLVSDEDARRWLNEYTKLSIPHTLIHLNDSTRDRGSGQDSHMALCKGKIWHEYDHGKFRESGAYSILQWASKHSVDVILERDEEGLISDFGTLRKAGMVRHP
jgi:endonuclease IV